MVMQPPSLFPEVQEAVIPPGKGMHAYFKRQRDGWIATHGAWPSAQSDMAFKGWVHQPQFGVFPMPGPGGGSAATDRRGVPFNPADEPWRLILQHPDGAAAFSVAQIIAYRWHIRPPYREVRFPQIEGIDITNYFCPECDKGIFSSPREQEAADLLRQHLTSQFDAHHSYRTEDLRSLGDEIGIDFFAARRVDRDRVFRDEQPEPPSLVVEEEVPELTPDPDVVVCHECGKEFDNIAKLRGHVMGAHKAKKLEEVEAGT